MKKLIFALVPTVVLLVAAEAAIRLFSLDRPSIFGGGFMLQEGSTARVDTDLGWSLTPNTRTTRPSGLIYTTNSLGLRSPEVPRVKGNEFRILSLGESSSFGVSVSDGETYASRLEQLLNFPQPSRPVRVINAGVSAYSSTQSLRYLKLRGLALQPDLVIFYHEMNDYLPATIRDIEVTGMDLLRTDRQLLDSRTNRLSRVFQRHSAIYRFLSDRYATFLFRGFQEKRAGIDGSGAFPRGEIGFPQGEGYQLDGWPKEVGADGRPQAVPYLHPTFLGRRVSVAERLENLDELQRFCAEKGIRLVIVHPAYQPTLRHDCLLTRFCREHKVPMLEAFDVLHPADYAPEFAPLYHDPIHPSAAGHLRLAQALSSFILATFGRI